MAKRDQATEDEKMAIVLEFRNTDLMKLKLDTLQKIKALYDQDPKKS